jgi:hypothetical protein
LKRRDRSFSSKDIFFLHPGHSIINFFIITFLCPARQSTFLFDPLLMVFHAWNAKKVTQKTPRLKKGSWPKPGTLARYGRNERIRTSGPLNPIQVRYQTALRSDIFFFVYLPMLGCPVKICFTADWTETIPLFPAWPSTAAALSSASHTVRQRTGPFSPRQLFCRPPALPYAWPGIFWHRQW